MNRLKIIGSTLLLGLAFGCSKDAEVIEFTHKLDGFTTEIVSRVEKASDHKAGTEAAQQYLEQNQGDIKGAYAELQNVRGYQVKKETMEQLTKSVTDNTSKVLGLKLKYVSETLSDKDFDAKLDKLGDSYGKIFE